MKVFLLVEQEYADRMAGATEDPPPRVVGVYTDRNAAYDLMEEKNKHASWVSYRIKEVTL